MKKLLGLALLGSLVFAGAADAAFYRVDFSGAVISNGSVSGSYDGYFTYDTDGLNLDGSNGTAATPDGADDLPSAGFESELLFNYSFPGVGGSFDENSGGVGYLSFSSGKLINWFIGGNTRSLNTVFLGGPNNDSFDLGLCGNCSNFSGYLATLNYDEVPLTFPNWQVTEISAVPLPAAVWAFGAGLLGLLGLKRRRKMKMLRTATA
ncbi:hypothetical protein GQF03_00265 [Sneathiella chungangensis]|uniref:VPLPA-CTERM sorting domain-containing protein n=1 Tax=Sneathiella chungangensis TaxID=1418234 RepID=A0A845M7Y1_9PROT|nr:hypothetical protein [Sneathiella chungangensis]MZR20759.1 hypothetical protein [Sneathiella chungangensis]